MSDEQPTQQQPPDEPPRPQRPPLTRSTTDSVIGGVAGGLGRHLNVDPLAIRITFVILAFAGGLGILAYIAFLCSSRATIRPSRSAGASRASSAPVCS